MRARLPSQSSSRARAAESGSPTQTTFMGRFPASVSCLGVNTHRQSTAAGCFAAS